ncbi:hypothetical protein SAMN04488601_101474 [Paenibacillus sp. 453mf]|nr:hypothetical protein SAMN04488601_101474 [Paenibacillus sp. 453mf]
MIPNKTKDNEGKAGRDKIFFILLDFIYNRNGFTSFF